MITSLLMLSATLAAAAPADMSKPPEVAPMRAVKLPPRSEWKLENGMSVVLVTDKRVPLVTARLALAGGEAAIAAEDAGLADALAELLTDGTAKKTSKEIAEAAELFGGSLSAGAEPDSIVLRASALADKADAMASLLAEVARSPSFPEAEVALRKANMKEELAASRAESDFLASVAFYKKVFAGHPYAVTAPTDASIERVSRESVAAAYKRLFTPRGALLILVGDISRHDAEALVVRNFGTWQGGPAAKDAPPVAAAKAERTVYLLDRPKSSQVSFMLGNPAIREDNPAYFDLLIANQVLGGSFSSRLVRDIRETKGYTYRIGSRLEHRLTGSLFKIRTPVRTEVAEPALAAILDHLDKIRKGDATADELRQAKAYLAGSFARSLETQDGVADAVLKLRARRLPADWYDSYVDRVQGVTAAGARRAAEVFIRPDELTIVAVGDASKAASVLAKFTKKPIVTVDQDGN
ncbi:MAG: pitrilysin family protein [Elusimicrobia bacterium]|nr:pitrilysin family protein [Elusimicrobiota bacterium]